MAGEITETLASLRMVSTHEHLRTEDEWVTHGPDVLQDLFGHYAHHDLLVAGASPEAVRRLLDPSSGTPAERFEGIRSAWEACRFTGYGEAVRILAHEVHGLEELPHGLEEADEHLAALRRPGERLRLLRDVALLDHVQIDDARIAVEIDASGPGYFLHDISLWSLCRGDVDREAIYAASGVEVASLEDLRSAVTAIVARYAPLAIAVKSQHAYDRTLLWQERTDEEAARALADVLGQATPAEESRIVLGDWCLARGVELAIEHDLPVKLHTGYHARSGRMPIEWIRPGHLCGLLACYPRARFVLMHAAYPYGEELVAVAKHYGNVWVDLCWAWSIDPHAVSGFVRSFLHAVPVNKLFAFGGDTQWPTSVLAYALQARRRLAGVLEAEVAGGDLTVAEAIEIARRVTSENQLAVFDVERVRTVASGAAVPL